MVDAVGVSPVEVLKELGDFASSFNGRRRWAPVEPGVSVRVAAARLARGAKCAAEYYVVRGKETVDTMEDFEVHTKIITVEENDWDRDSGDDWSVLGSDDDADEADRATLLDQMLGDHLALAVGTLEEDLPHMRRNLGGADPDVLAFEQRLVELRAALRAREASRPATLCTIYVLSFFPPLNGQKLCLKVRPGDTVLSLKQKIRDSTNIPLERQRLIIRGRQLVDGKRLYESNVFDGTTVHLVLRPPPGGWCSRWWGE